MRSSVSFIIVIVNFTLAGCASAASPARLDYILSKPHGWVELTVVDEAIPAAPPEKDKQQNTPQPPKCHIAAEINREHFFSESLYPIGENPPYRLNTGYRFAVPLGRGKLVVNYSNCDVKDGKSIELSYKTTITVEEGNVTPVQFNGVNLTVGTNQENSNATLEEINNRLKKIESLVDHAKP